MSAGDDSPARREMTDVPHDHATCVSPINAFAGHMMDFRLELIGRISG